jgi:indole-3-acetate monooxygenase
MEAVANGSSAARVAPLLDRVDDLATEIRRGGTAIRAGGPIPTSVITALQDAGVFAMLLPRSRGGAELSLPEGASVIEAMARADGSTAWVAMIAAGFATIWPRLPEETSRAAFAGGGMPLVRGAIAPKGVARRVPGGYRVSGHWPLASGDYRCDWVLAGCIVEGEQRDGIPEIRMMLVRDDEVTFAANWDALGLAGTRSDDFAIDDVFVPEAHGFDYFKSGEEAETLGRLPLLLTLLPAHCGVVLGIAAGALDDVAALASTKRSLLNPAAPLGEDGVFQFRFGQLSLRHAAARALFRSEIDALWQQAEAGDAIDANRRVGFRAMVAHVHRECMAVTDEAMALAGSAGVYRDSVLQQRWRDIRVANQHLAASAEIFQYWGALRLGLHPPVVEFL